jgi:ectoine hydroxylase-related dioxygenase (phytanoyl-CoA dioxygenase family)
LSLVKGNPETWAHQDTYCLDAEELGRMTAAWIALEDSHPGAGRFYVYPGSRTYAAILSRSRAGLVRTQKFLKKVKLRLPS